MLMLKQPTTQCELLQHQHAWPPLRTAVHCRWLLRALCLVGLTCGDLSEVGWVAGGSARSALAWIDLT